ncbi:uncharacterized protein C1orf167 homolog [Dasypus novemcinctus]|uniref:uncharacterized protein C1orf167 homolog n=1 Tax=Dasypus novemcinctus TaxID=9361 RepID=UPI0039C9CB32
MKEKQDGLAIRVGALQAGEQLLDSLRGRERACQADALSIGPSPLPVLSLDQWRFLESLGLGSGCGRWVSLCQAERGGPARAASPGAARVQSNVAGPGLQDPTSSSARPGSRQQNNLQPRARRPPGRTRACAVQQSNLSRSGPGPPLRLGPGESLGPRARYQDSPLQRRPLAHLAPSLQRLPAIDVPCPDGRPLVGLGSLEEPTQPGPSSWGDLGSWPLGSGAESLTLEDLAVPAWSRARSPSQAAIHQLLASVQRLEHQVARLGRRASQKPPGPARQDPRSSRSQALSARPQLSQSLPASRGARGPPRGLRASAGLPEVPGVQEECPASGANSEPALAETTVGVLPGGPLDPEQGLLPAHPPSQGQECSPGPMDGGEPEGRPSLPGGAGSREASLCASASATPARGVPPGQEAGEGSPEEQASREEEKTASCPPDAAPVRGALQNEAQNTVTLEPETASRPLLSRCFRAWWRSAQRQRAVAETEALNRQHLLPKGLRGLRGAPWLCEAWLEAVRGQHTQALLTRSFREWKDLAAQRKQGQPHLQAGPGPPASGGGPDQGPLGRKAAVDPVQENSPGSLREEEGAWPTPGGRPDDGGVRGQVLQALERLAVFILWCHQKGGAGKKKGCLGEAAQVPQRTQRPGRPPQAWRAPAADVAWVAHLGTWGQRAWLRRCFAAWQQFKQRGARFRDHLADRRLGTLRTCLRQWVRMKQLRASDGAKVTQLYLCLQKAGERVVDPGPGPGHQLSTFFRGPQGSRRGCGRLISRCFSGAAALLGAAPGTATAHSPRPVAQGRAQGSLQDACRRLALHRALLLWRTRLSQRQQADRFLQGMRQRTLRRVLTQWHRRMWPLCSPPGGRRQAGWRGTARGPMGGRGGAAGAGARTQVSPLLLQAPRDPCLLETLRASFLQAAGQRWRGQCLLLWRARAQQSQGAARWSQHTLQRRVLLSWGHWAAAQGDRRELAARWAQGRSYRAALGLWRQRLAQWREAEQWAQERSRALARDALRHWHTCWQIGAQGSGLGRPGGAPRWSTSASLAPGQQSLRAKYQRWVQIRVQGLRKAAFWGWQRAAARRTHRAAGRERLLLQRPKNRGGLLLRNRQRGHSKESRSSPGVGDARLRKNHGDRLSAGTGLQCGVTEARGRGCAQQAFVAWPVALDREWGPVGVLQTPMALGTDSPSPPRILEAWVQAAAQGRVQRAAVAQLQQARCRRLLRTRWARWRAALPRVRLEAPARAEEAQEAAGAQEAEETPGGCTVYPQPEAGLGHCLLAATGGRLLLLMDAPAAGRQPGAGKELPGHLCPCKSEPTPFRLHSGCSQTGSGWTQATGLVPPASAWLHSCGGQRKWRETFWPRGKGALPLGTVCAVQGNGERDSRLHPAPSQLPLRQDFQLWLPWPMHYSWAQGERLWTEPGGDCSCETRALQGEGEAQQRRLGSEQLDPPQALCLQEEVPAALAPRGSAWPAPGCPAGPAPDSDLAVLGGCSRGRAAGTDTGEWGQPLPVPTAERDPRGHGAHLPSRPCSSGRRGRGGSCLGAWRSDCSGSSPVPSLPTVPTAQAAAPGMGLGDVASAHPAAAGGSASTAARRLCAFEKWHQHLAARGPQRVAASSPKPLSKLGARGPGSSGKTRALAVVGLGRAWGPAAAVDLLFPKRRKQSCTLPSPGKELHPTHPASEALTRPGGRGTVRL